VEITFDRDRFSKLAVEKDHMRRLKYWNGSQYEEHTRYPFQNQEHYALDAVPWRFLHPEELMIDVSWPRAQPHSFWWNPRDVQAAVRYWGRPEEFTLIGEEEYSGKHCYVLEYSGEPRPRRWYVGKRDGLLYGYHTLTDSGTPWRKWRTWDYQEAAPGCWYPAQQSHESFNTEHGHLSFRQSLEVVAIEVNKPLPERLFQIEFRDGVTVADYRFGAMISYPYKADRSPAEWEQIRADALSRYERRQAELGVRDLEGEAAPELPAMQWINGPPLRLEELRGKVVLLSFWAVWSGRCAEVLPALEKLSGEPAAKSGVVVIGIHAPGSDVQTITRKMEQFGARYPVCLDLPTVEPREGFGRAFAAYGIDRLPYTIVLDREGRIAGHSAHVPKMVDLAREITGQPASRPATSPAY
jgi:thiol-disulfide isomerase/thioredoxin